MISKTRAGGAGCFQQPPRRRREAHLASARMMLLRLGGGEPPANLKGDDLSRLDVPLTVAFGQAARPLFEIASRAVAQAVPSAELQPRRLFRLNVFRTSSVARTGRRRGSARLSFPCFPSRGQPRSSSASFPPTEAWISLSARIARKAMDRPAIRPMPASALPRAT